MGPLRSGDTSVLVATASFHQLSPTKRFRSVFILDIVDLFLAEMIGSAQGGYFVTYIIGEAVGHTASVWLLLLMYTMLNQLFSRYSWKPATRGTVMNWVHWAVCGVLAIISVAVIVCSARYQVQRIRDGPSPSVLVATRQWGLYEAWTRVRTVYDAVYLAASLELLALAVYKYFRSRKLGSSDQVGHIDQSLPARGPAKTASRSSVTSSGLSPCRTACARWPASP